ncbi:MAG: LptA/OstA family protein [Alphaproteobacteria bacterium]|nr:LptA/OstA family protein [Alphaproteobacteria bacterium]
MNASLRYLSLAALAACLMAGPALAKGKAALQAPATVSEMVDISADESLEWYKDTRLYVARGKARAVRGAMIVEADLLTAHARDPQEGGAKTQGGSIDTMTAEGHVVIRDDKQQVYGDRAVYDLDAKLVKITGSNLRYVTDKDTVTAKDSLEYDEGQSTALARGRAMAEHQGSRIEADILAASLETGATGAKEISKIRAKGNVIIVTKDGGVSRGERAEYDAKQDKAYLMDQVRITRDQTQLAGDKAEIDFKTGQSRLLNSGGGRVRALLPSASPSKNKGEQP